MFKKKKMSSFLLCTTLSLLLTACTPTQATNNSVAAPAPSFKDYSSTAPVDAIYNHIATLASKDNARVTGFDGEKDAAEYIKKQFESAGLKVETQPFPIVAFLNNGNSLKMNSELIPSKLLSFSAGTSEEGITAELVDGDLGLDAQIDNLDVKNKIVLMKSGGDYYRSKVERVANKGALGTIFYNPKSDSDNPVSATLVYESKIPAVSVSKSYAIKLFEALSADKNTKVYLKVDTICKPGESKNVIGSLKAKNETKDTKTLIIGAHYDGVDTPAADDNASGIATVMEMAKMLSKEPLQCNIKFIAFGSEETGLLGSAYYVKNMTPDDFSSTIGMINLDMIGAGNTLFLRTLSENSQSFTAAIGESCAKQFKYSYTKNASNSSDHASFAEYSIPEVLIEFGPYEEYHTDKDTIAIIDKGTLTKAFNIATSMANEIAQNPNKYKK